MEFQGLQAFIHYLTIDAPKDIPKAQSRAVNNWAFGLNKHLRNELPKHVTLRSRFLTGSLQYSKSQTRGEVGFLERVHFADLLVSGGKRRASLAKFIAVPVRSALKVPYQRRITASKRPEKLLQNPRYFFDPRRNKHIIWRRIGRGRKQKVTAAYFLVKEADYQKKHFPFFTLAENWSDDFNIEAEFLKQLERSMR